MHGSMPDAIARRMTRAAAIGAAPASRGWSWLAGDMARPPARNGHHGSPKTRFARCGFYPAMTCLLFKTWE